MASSTSNRLLFRNTMQIKEGHIEEFREAIVDAVEFAQSNAPQLLVDVFIDEVELTATSFQMYSDSEAVLEHWQASDPYIAEVMRHCSVTRFEVFGTPSAAVLAGLQHMKEIPLLVVPRLVGYLQGAGA